MSDHSLWAWDTPQVCTHKFHVVGSKCPFIPWKSTVVFPFLKTLRNITFAGVNCYFTEILFRKDYFFYLKSVYELVHPILKMVSPKEKQKYKELRTFPPCLSEFSSYELLVTPWRNASWGGMLSRFLCIFYRKSIPFLSKVCHLPHLPGRFSEILSVHSCLSAYFIDAYQTLSLCQFIMFLGTLIIWVNFSGLLGSLQWGQWTLHWELMKGIVLRNCPLPISVVSMLKNPATTSLKWIDSFLTPELQMRWQMQEYPKPTPSHDHTECHNKLSLVDAFWVQRLFKGCAPAVAYMVGHQ